MEQLQFTTIGRVVAAAVLAACGPQDGGGAGTMATPADASAAKTAGPVSRTQATVPPAPGGDLGTVKAVVSLRTQEDPSGAGALIGGVVGAAVGNQVGGGDGRKVATVLGAVGGAAAGHQIEKDRKTRVTGYRIDVQLDDGRQASVTLAEPGPLAAGQRVRVVDGSLRPT